MPRRIEDFLRGAQVYLTLILVCLAMIGSVVRPAAAQTDYRLNVGDVIEFDFLRDEDEPRRLVIANDGRVQLPLIGGIPIAGLPISGARDKIVKEYVDRGLLVDPLIDIAIADYRPVFVLGDVREPGSFPFRPLLTVEQAVGLAGGPSTLLGNEEDRILMRSTLRSDLDEVEASLAREAVWAARLSASLDARSTIDDADLPAKARRYLDDGLLAELKATEEQILSVDNGAFTEQVSLLDTSTEQARHEIELLEGLVENQQASIAYYEEDVARSKQLQDRGLTAQSEVSRREQSVTAARSGLLQIYGEIARARRNLSGLERELSETKAKHRQETLLAIQERQVEISKLLANHDSIEERLALLTSWSEADVERAAAATIDYKIRRLDGGSPTFVAATAVTELLPGDVLTIVVKRPERSRSRQPAAAAPTPAAPASEPVAASAS